MKKEIIFFIAGIALLVFVLANIYLWIDIATDSSKTFLQAKEEFYSRLPAFMTQRYWLEGINILALALGIFCFSKCMHVLMLKTTSKLLAGLSGVLIAWQLFTLM
jgi:hypothetical protein